MEREYRRMIITDMTKCIDAEKYCKDYKNCMRCEMPELEKFQSYEGFHRGKETDGSKCDFYISRYREY